MPTKEKVASREKSRLVENGLKDNHHFLFLIVVRMDAFRFTIIMNYIGKGSFKGSNLCTFFSAMGGRPKYRVRMEKNHGKYAYILNGWMDYKTFSLIR